MVNVIIPIYNGVELLNIPLDSLLKQKQSKSDFIVTIIQDLDNLDYTDIIDYYKGAGLNIDFIKATERLKQGKARQLGIDSHPEAEYVMFLDQDDEYLPESIQFLYGKIKSTKADVCFSNFIKETAEDSEIVNQQHSDIITQLHGKIYSTEYLKRCDIRFSEKLQYAEDSCFNLMAFYCTTNIGYVDRITYRWNYNKNSESNFNSIEYFKNMYADYIKGQIESLLHIYKYNPEGNQQLVIRILLYFYQIVMVQRDQGFVDNTYQDALIELGKQDYIKEIFKDNSLLLFMSTNVRGGWNFQETPIFFGYSYMDWVHEWLEQD